MLHPAQGDKASDEAAKVSTKPDVVPADQPATGPILLTKKIPIEVGVPYEPSDALTQKLTEPC